jgi:hypothetical protein
MKERFATTSATGRIRLPESRREDLQLRVKSGRSPPASVANLRDSMNAMELQGDGGPLKIGKMGFPQRPANDIQQNRSSYDSKSNVFVSDHLPNMGPPRFQSFSAFGEEIVALIDGRNA